MKMSKRLSYNSENMSQVPFDFFEKDHNEIKYSNQEQLAFALEYFKDPVGYLHLTWNIDAYWTMVAKRAMIPMMSAIYDKLVSSGFIEDNKCDWGDLDGCVFFIPIKNSSTKVVVHETQNRDFLYILDQNLLNENTFHIRRIWKRWSDKRNWQRDDKDDLIGKRGSIYKVLSNLDSLEEFSDDHSKYPKRRSLEFYRKRKFDMNSREFNGIYGDCRDDGYIFSLKNNHRAEGDCAVQFNNLQLIATCYLPSLIQELNLPIPQGCESFFY